MFWPHGPDERCWVGLWVRSCLILLCSTGTAGAKSCHMGPAWPGTNIVTQTFESWRWYSGGSVNFQTYEEICGPDDMVLSVGKICYCQM